MTVNKENKALGSFKHSVGTANTKDFFILYQSLVRPILKYAVPVWCPSLGKDIHGLRMYNKEYQDLHSTSAKKSCPTKADSNFKRNGLLCWTAEVECYEIFFSFYFTIWHLKLTFFSISLQLGARKPTLGTNFTWIAQDLKLL